MYESYLAMWASFAFLCTSWTCEWYLIEVSIRSYPLDRWLFVDVDDTNTLRNFRARHCQTINLVDHYSYSFSMCIYELSREIFSIDRYVCMKIINFVVSIKMKILIVSIVIVITWCYSTRHSLSEPDLRSRSMRSVAQTRFSSWSATRRLEASVWSVMIGVICRLVIIGHEICHTDITERTMHYGKNPVHRRADDWSALLQLRSAWSGSRSIQDELFSWLKWSSWGRMIKWET